MTNKPFAKQKNYSRVDRKRQLKHPGIRENDEDGPPSKVLELRGIRTLLVIFVVHKIAGLDGCRTFESNCSKVPPCLRRSACPPQGFWKSGFAQAGLRLLQLAPLCLSLLREDLFFYCQTGVDP
jgi:hypothetical protein